MDALAQVDANIERMDRDGLKAILRDLLRSEQKRNNSRGNKSRYKKEEKELLWAFVLGGRRSFPFAL